MPEHLVPNRRMLHSFFYSQVINFSPYYAKIL
jgi:hypothetical protein